MDEALRRLAEAALDDFRQFGIELAYDRRAVCYLDGFIEDVRGQYRQKKDVFALTERLGAVFGAHLMARYGGRWRYYEAAGHWGVQFDDGAWVFPFIKVYRQFRHGQRHAIVDLYDRAVRLVHDSN